jgi:hypothetical protein
MPKSTLAPSLPGVRRRARAWPPAKLAGVWLMAVTLAAGCAQTTPIQSTAPTTGTTGGQATTVPAQFSDLPMPQGAKLNVDKTLVVGTQNWFGQLTLDTSQSADTMFEFYSRELTNYGWRRIAAVRAPTSILTYDRDNRVLAIAIQPSRVYGSEITVTVSPREDAMPDGPASGTAVGPASGPMGGRMGGRMGGPAGDSGPIMPPPVRQLR